LLSQRHEYLLQRDRVLILPQTRNIVIISAEERLAKALFAEGRGFRIGARRVLAPCPPIPLRHGNRAEVLAPSVAPPAPCPAWGEISWASCPQFPSGERYPPPTAARTAALPAPTFATQMKPQPSVTLSPSPKRPPATSLTISENSSLRPPDVTEIAGGGHPPAPLLREQFLLSGTVRRWDRLIRPVPSFFLSSIFFASYLSLSPKFSRHRPRRHRPRRHRLRRHRRHRHHHPRRRRRHPARHQLLSPGAFHRQRSPGPPLCRQS